MIYIGGDKHGYKVITYVEEYLKKNGLEYVNEGVKNEHEDMQLEELIPKVMRGVLANQNNRGILTCGSGIGVEVGANKFSGIRASLATDPKIAEWSVVYDKCNVICLVGWNSKKDSVFNILDAWFNAMYDGSEKRLKMFEEFDKWH